MAIKKSELYSSLWKSCDVLRGGMDASQYKDYVLVMLFLRYVSDKAKADPDALIHVPERCKFEAIGALKGQKDIGEKMDVIIGELAKENDLQGIIDQVSFNDEERLGKGKDMQDRLSALVGIFEDPKLDFTKNRAGGDDLLGDAYEYLMMHFATESGKSKGQFYTPSEVSRILAAVLEVKPEKRGQTIYDPTCGSGSLLLKVGDAITVGASLYGQEMDQATGALAKMNMILHDSPTAEIDKGYSTLSRPKWAKDGRLKQFDYIVANPPFSSKNWRQGFIPEQDEYDRFDGFGMPPNKNGDYAFMLHILASLKSQGKAAVILPHGVLFRGNTEEDIRTKLIQRGYIKGIIGLPANLFYGTGIPACVLILDKEGAEQREHIFMVNAAEGFIKAGAKNRLREQDLRLIIDVFANRTEIPRYSRQVPIAEIADEKNGYNLNLPRYIDMQEDEDIQDIDAHLNGGIPARDLDGLQRFWDAFPGLRETLFAPKRPGYFKPLTTKQELRQAISAFPSFAKFEQNLTTVFDKWKAAVEPQMRSLEADSRPKQFLASVSDALLIAFDELPLLDEYDMYQHLMDFWETTLQDDAYLIAQAGWVAKPVRVLETKKGKEVLKSWTCDLVPKQLVIDTYFSDEDAAIDVLKSELETLNESMETFEEEHSGDGGVLSMMDKVNKGNVTKQLKEAKTVSGAENEVAVLTELLGMFNDQSKLKKSIKEADKALDLKALAKYAELSEPDIKDMVVGRKWLGTLESSVQKEMRDISNRLSQRLIELMERYEDTLPELEAELESLNQKVRGHLQKMGFSWS